MANIKKIKISGLTSYGTEVKQPFVGEIFLEKRKDCVYYTWTLQREGNKEFLAMVSRPVSFKIIPKEADIFGFALQHAINGINKYRMGRKRVFEVKKWKRCLFPRIRSIRWPP